MSEKTLLPMLIESFLKEHGVQVLHQWNEKEKLLAFTTWLVAQKFGIETVQQLKKLHDEEMAEYLYEGSP